jgi:hypothetical protein
MTVVITLALIYPMYAWATPEVGRAVLASGIIAFSNLILGYFSLELTIDKSTGVFMAAVFGGMGVRIMLILAAVAVLVMKGFHPGSLVLSLMAFYVTSMIAELTYVMRDLGRRSEMARAARRAEKQAGKQNFTLRTVSL